MQTDDGRDRGDEEPEQRPQGTVSTPPGELVDPACMAPAPISGPASAPPVASQPVLLLLGTPTAAPQSEVVAPRPAPLTLESTFTMLTPALAPHEPPKPRPGLDAPLLLLAPPLDLHASALPEPELEVSAADLEAQAVADKAPEEAESTSSAVALVSPDAELFDTAVSDWAEAHAPAAPAHVSNDLLDSVAFAAAEIHTAAEPDLPTESATRLAEPALDTPEPTAPLRVPPPPFGAVQWPRLEHEPLMPAPPPPPIAPIAPEYEPERGPILPEGDYRLPEPAPIPPPRPEATSAPALIASVLADITSALTSPALPTPGRTTPPAPPPRSPLTPPPAPITPDIDRPITAVPAPAPVRRPTTTVPLPARQATSHRTRVLARRRLAWWALAIKGVFIAAEIPVVLALAIYSGVMPLLPASPPIARVLASGQSGAVLARQSTYCWFTPGQGGCVTPTAAPEQSLPIVSARKGSTLQISFAYPAPTACAAAIPDGASTQGVMKQLGSLRARDDGGALPARTFQLPISLAPGTYRLNVSCVWHPPQSLRWLQGQGESAYWVGLRILPA